jgi:hypothetical protein
MISWMGDRIERFVATGAGVVLMTDFAFVPVVPRSLRVARFGAAALAFVETAFRVVLTDVYPYFWSIALSLRTGSRGTTRRLHGLTGAPRNSVST